MIINISEVLKYNLFNHFDVKILFITNGTFQNHKKN